MGQEMPGLTSGLLVSKSHSAPALPAQVVLGPTPRFLFCFSKWILHAHMLTSPSPASGAGAQPYPYSSGSLKCECESTLHVLQCTLAVYCFLKSRDMSAFKCALIFLILFSPLILEVCKGKNICAQSYSSQFHCFLTAQEVFGLKSMHQPQS